MVDGDPSEWAPGDWFADLTQAGQAWRPISGSLYLRYDCTTETLYAWVDAAGEGRFRADRPSQAYLRIDGSGKRVHGKSGDDGIAPDFAWVARDGRLARGWEASARVAPDARSIRAHVLMAWDDDDGYLKLDTMPRHTRLDIDCAEAPSPTPSPRPTPSKPRPTPEATSAATASPDATAEPTARPPRATPDPTAKPTPKPTKTPKPTRTPKPTDTHDPDRDEDKGKDDDKAKNGDKGKGDDKAENGDHRNGKGDDGKDKGQGKDKGEPSAGLVIMLPFLAGTAAWSTHPERLRRRLRRR